MQNNIIDNIRKVTFCLIGLMIILLLYVTYIQVVKSDFLHAHPLNRRTDELAKRVERGKIIDSQGEIVALSVLNKTGSQYIRKYPFGAIFAHVTGYDSIRYGRAGLEAVYNGYLSGLTQPEYRLGVLAHFIAKNQGNTIHLTLDASLQEEAYKALGNRRGAIIAISPRTGAILAMVSKPSYNPNLIDEEWSNISSGKDSPLLNRGLQGLYPPGSIIKPMIAETALREKITNEKKTYRCEGVLKIGPDYILPEAGRKAHGNVNLEEALAVSCNVTFGQLALALGRDRLNTAYERYGFHKPAMDDLPETASRIPDCRQLGDGELAQLGIGQGSLLVTPLRMAMLASAFANQGIIMQPYLVSKITAPDSSTILKEFKPKQWLVPIESKTAQSVGRMMESVISEGTGYAARIPGITVAGKTGTAENPHGNPHAWFIGYAPADKPKIAVAVVVENAGSGGEVAAPIAREVLLEAIR